MRLWLRKLVLWLLTSPLPKQQQTAREENSNYTISMASDSIAEKIVAFAKNCLNEFYNTKLYKTPPAGPHHCRITLKGRASYRIVVAF